MKAVERRMHQQAAGQYRRMLRDLERLGPCSESPEDLDAFGAVKDYLLDRADGHQQAIGVQP